VRRLDRDSVLPWHPPQGGFWLDQATSSRCCGTTRSGAFLLHYDGNPRLLFTENDTNNERIFGRPNATPYFKDGINNYVVGGWQDAVNPAQTGTKAAAHYQLKVEACQTAIIRYS
jgi:hypothetical protein